MSAAKLFLIYLELQNNFIPDECYYSIRILHTQLKLACGSLQVKHFRIKSQNPIKYQYLKFLPWSKSTACVSRMILFQQSFWWVESTAWIKQFSFLLFEHEKSNLLWKLIFIPNPPPRRANHLSDHYSRSSGSSLSCNQEIRLTFRSLGEKTTTTTTTQSIHTQSSLHNLILIYKVGSFAFIWNMLCVSSKMEFSFFWEHF